MLRILIPVVLALVGLGGGIGAGLFLRPAAPPADARAGTAHAAAAPQHGSSPPEHGSASAEKAPAKTGGHGSGGDAGKTYVKLNNQFIVPIVVKGKVASLVILSLSVEVEGGGSAAIYAAEPKLRDVFLQVLFAHANAGGFDGNFTDGTKLAALRRALLEVAQKALGAMITDVLIDDIVRQDT